MGEIMSSFVRSSEETRAEWHSRAHKVPIFCSSSLNSGCDDLTCDFRDDRVVPTYVHSGKEQRQTVFHSAAPSPCSGETFHLNLRCVMVSRQAESGNGFAVGWVLA